MPVWALTLLKGIGGFFTKILPFLLVFKSGKDSVKRKSSERELEDVKEINKVEDRVKHTSHDDNVNWLSNRRKNRSGNKK